MTTYNQQLMHDAARAVRRNAIATLLHKVFGLARLRDGQCQVIDSVLDGTDTLAIMPAGSGKSLCYQIPARLIDGATIVVSPLISRMKDQLEKLVERGISATQVNSSLSREGHPQRRAQNRVLYAGAAPGAGDRIFVSSGDALHCVR